MKLSKLASEIAESPTFALNEEARLLRERGEAVINLGIGEPRNKTPISAVLASAAKLTSGEVKYTPPDGLPSMKKAVIRYTEENYDRLVAPENVSITNGAKQSLFNILYSILNPQDEVIVIMNFSAIHQTVMPELGLKKWLLLLNSADTAWDGPSDSNKNPTIEKGSQVVIQPESCLIYSSTDV